MKFLKPAAFAAMMAVFGTAAAAEDVINAVHFAPTPHGLTQSFLRFVEKVNEKGKGVVRIDVKGGPEIIPNPQLGTAQQAGLIDMIHTPAGLYLELVPEGEAFAASTLAPWEHRENGGWALMDSIYQKKGNAKLIAHIDAGNGFHIWTVNEPKLTEDGMLDFKDIVVRASPLYKTFFENLGATLIIQPAGDVYTSLERGVINANAYPSLGYSSFGWDKFTKYRIDPEYFRTDVLISMNLDSWESLSDESKKILEEVAIEHEKSSFEDGQKATAAEEAKMIADGQKVVTMTGAGRERFLKMAADASWQRMESRDMTHIAKLRELFR